jgi:hypothetical protein
MCDGYIKILNQLAVLINRLRKLDSQCSEIYGILHSCMPIFVESVLLVHFFVLTARSIVL